MHPIEKLPIETQHDASGYELFEDIILHNSEVCNNCFEQVRTIGPEYTKRLNTSGRRTLADGKPLSMTTNEWYKRTIHGSQEHTDWDSNKRFGTCFCLECGTDCNGNHRNKSLQELTPLARNIYLYVTRCTPHSLDGKQFGREIRELKHEPSLQGYETEIMALAFSRALDRNLDSADLTGDSEASGHRTTAD